MADTRHIKALDGIRGLAIILVMFRHLSLRTMGQSATSPPVDRIVHLSASVGWVGVDLFFVLSGFLITGILLDGKGETGAFPRFWKRRALRIFPLYYVACAFLFFVLPEIGYFARDPSTARLVHNQAWYWLYGVNILEVVRGGLATPLNTGHFWSLSVEEQFYLAWPLVVLLVSRKALWRVVVGMSVAALCVRIVLVCFMPRGWAGAYVLSVARMDILGAGAIVALAVRTHGALAIARRYAPTVGVAAVACLSLLAVQGVGGFNNVNSLIATAGYSLLAVAGACLLVMVLASEDGRDWKRVFEGGTLRTFGKYSYCLYIVHYPLMIPLDLVALRYPVMRLGSSSLPGWMIYSAILFGVSLLIAMVSWRVLEAPMLALKERRLGLGFGSGSTVRITG